MKASVAMLAGAVALGATVACSPIPSMSASQAAPMTVLAWVQRGEDPNDRRATRVVPTDAARALVERLYAYRQEAFRSLLAHSSTETLRKLADGLEGLELAARERANP